MLQGEIKACQITAVPAVFLNDETFGTGRIGMEETLARIGAGAAARDTEKLAAKEAFDVLIIGGGPAGMMAAVHAVHEGMRTGVTIEHFSGQVLGTLGIENLAPAQETKGLEFAVALEQHVYQYNVGTINTQCAVRLTSTSRPGDSTEVTLANSTVLKGRSIILPIDAH